MSEQDCNNCSDLQAKIDDLEAQLDDSRTEATRLTDEVTRHEDRADTAEEDATDMRAIIGRIADSVLDIDTAVAEAVK